MTISAVQTTMTTAPAIGMPGMLYDSSGFKDVVSLRAQEAIPFGAAVRITGSDCELPDSSGEVTGNEIGIAVHSQEKANQGGYIAGDIVPVMRVGRIWVETEEAIAAGVQPYIRFTPNTSPTRPAGGFLNGADSAKAVQRPGIVVFRGVAGAGLAVLQLSPGVAGATGATGATGPTGPTGA